MAQGISARELFIDGQSADFLSCFLDGHGEIGGIDGLGGEQQRIIDCPLGPLRGFGARDNQSRRALKAGGLGGGIKQLVDLYGSQALGHKNHIHEWQRRRIIDRGLCVVPPAVP